MSLRQTVATDPSRGLTDILRLRDIPSRKRRHAFIPNFQSKFRNSSIFLSRARALLFLFPSSIAYTLHAYCLHTLVHSRFSETRDVRVVARDRESRTKRQNISRKCLEFREKQKSYASFVSGATKGQCCPQRVFFNNLSR